MMVIAEVSRLGVGRQRGVGSFLGPLDSMRSSAGSTMDPPCPPCRAYVESAAGHVGRRGEEQAYCEYTHSPRRMSEGDGAFASGLSLHRAQVGLQSQQSDPVAADLGLVGLGAVLPRRVLVQLPDSL